VSSPAPQREAVDITLEHGVRVQGTFAGGFGQVVEAFVANFEQGEEVGAACAVYRNGHLVVDVFGGLRDRRTRAPWAADTRSVVFSASKGLLGICVALLVDRGEVDLDAPVGRYWPEFSAAGKGAITVRMALNHTAGLPYVESSLTRAEVLDWHPVLHALANQRSLWPAGESVQYHALTIGWLGGEILRRVSGLRPREFLEREVCLPLGLQVSFGITRGDDPADLARVEPPRPETDETAIALRAAIAGDPDALRPATMGGALPFPGFGGDDTYDSPDVLRAELPAANAVASAHDLARAYAATVADVDDTRLVSESALDQVATWSSGGGRQPLQGIGDPAMRWGVLFQTDSPPVRPMLGPGSFGHDGAGGQLAFANRPHRVAFAYTNNQMGGLLDQRANKLCDALAACLD
jgi:CubicO group peptidase (beta-lactamase class C family)